VVNTLCAPNTTAAENEMRGMSGEPLYPTGGLGEHRELTQPSLGGYLPRNEFGVYLFICHRTLLVEGKSSLFIDN